MSIQTSTLSNGLRIVTDSVPEMGTVAIGLWVGVGTRHEDLSHNGVAHMVEHMLFKGTKTRSAQQIAEVIENVGGSMNAYTSREMTSYHMHVMSEHAPLALEVLADMYQNSTLPEDEIERERQVILQEIGMCNDTPDDLVFDLYSETAYPDQALGAPILGRADNILAMDAPALNAHIAQFYTPQNTVIAAAGEIDHDALVKIAEGLFADLQAAPQSPLVAADYKGGEIRHSKDLEQCHFVLGFNGLSRMDTDYFAVQALANALGGGMSSRLFQEVRERRGLVYSIFSYHSGYQDDGQFAIYAGTGPEKMDEIIPVICDEVLKIGAHISEEELSRAKAQMKSSTLMSRESMMSRADQNAKYTVFRNQTFDLENLVRSIDEIKIDDIQRVAKQIFASKPTLAALGPLEKLEDYARIEERLAA